MVDEIFRLLGLYGLSEPFCCDLLKLLEDKGMIPPYSSKMFYKQWAEQRDDRGGNKWEPEDET